MDHRSIPNSGEDSEEKDGRPIINAAKRKKKYIHLEVELDLSGKFPMCNMLKSGLEGEKEPRTISVGDFKQKEDLERYGELTYYDEFRRYDMGIATDLSQIAEKIYADFHKSSWRTAKRHFLRCGPRTRYFEKSKILDGGDRKNEFAHGRMFGRVGEIPISDTFRELVASGCADYG